MENEMKKRLCVVTSTRADWGLLSPVCRALRDRGLLRIDIVATNMHLIERYGNTYREIEADGFDIACRVPTDVGSDDDASRALVMAKTMEGMTKAFDSLRPDAVLLLGDRYEMLAVASAAAVMHIPVIHIAGESIGFDVTKGPLAVVTYHPATNDVVAPEARLGQFLDALDRYPSLRLVVTAPNNDAGGERLLAMLEDYVSARHDRAVFVRSLGMVRYHSLLRCASLVIGNSSSGIVEVPSAGIPTVDVGIRQQGRISAPSVIHCAEDTDSVAEAIANALSPEMQALATERVNPYFKPDTCALMVEAVETFVSRLPLPPKHFYDLK